ncbi:hypothetical protein CWB41_15975 [Methylovirgula ligni]|uniref:Uncharacterized protein n=1 Tax=Methylovirgula ligni TaxID=569860 RepID=A0A3D9Z1K6_9HYPH|nr:hypothetical protein [Methylovirgula ligni]QAY97049.1 hypothetical protein CWB41_15975 [Methylovirgula ligni]REF87880.1 hypothetical protein DES32_1515 [Methylovirgula ligni]
MSDEIPAAELHRQKTSDLNDRVIRLAGIAASVVDPLLESAGSRPLTSQECDIGDEAIFALKRAIADLYAHREGAP